MLFRSRVRDVVDENSRDKVLSLTKQISLLSRRRTTVADAPATSLRGPRRPARRLRPATRRRRFNPGWFHFPARGLQLAGRRLHLAPRRTESGESFAPAGLQEAAPSHTKLRNAARAPRLHPWQGWLSPTHKNCGCGLRFTASDHTLAVRPHLVATRSLHFAIRDQIGRAHV